MSNTFWTRNHTYLYLGTSALAALTLVALTFWRSPYSFLTGVPYFVVSGVLGVWLLISAIAAADKILHWNTYATSSFFKRPKALTHARYTSYVVWATAALGLLDSPLMGIVGTALAAAGASARPDTFFEQSVYFFWQQRSMFVTGVSTTIGLAVFGTLIAFVLAVLFCFLRMMAPARQDNDFVKFWKVIGATFTKIYSTVIRGTPMMVQGLIIYFFGFGLFRDSGMTATEIGRIWSPFIAGLVTISLNSTAYMMEVLRGGIEAVDPGQAEAARSLGLSQWQTMMKVVFPQGVKNSIPALSNELVINIKDSSVLSVIAVFDVMYATTTTAGIYAMGLPIYVIAAVIYLMLTMIATKLLTLLAKRMDVSLAELPSSN